VLAAMQEVAGPDWLVVSEIGVDEAFRPLGEFKLAAILIAVISTGLLGFVLLTLWWRQASRYNEGMARQYRTLAERINAHKQLLESVTGALPDLIWLKRMDGPIVWGNKAFDKFGGGRRWQDAEFHESDIFGAPAERLLLQGDERALSENGVRLDERQIAIDGEERFVNLTKSPIRGDDGKANGLVGVVRDVTDIVRQRQRQQKLIRQMVASLTRAVELVDPYLLGHTRRLQDLTCHLAERLDCSQDDRATLELAAGLSQIGKIFVPREILTKPERHSEEETRLMQSHIDYALKVIDDVDFELPVRQTLSQMHERLDGTGYPNGLPADEIGQLARILAVADVFCARTSPRSYRDVISASEAVELLRTNINRYDIDVVEALEGLVAEWRDAPDTSGRENASLERDPADVSFRA
jgi:PAS domain S-box-containing protein